MDREVERTMHAVGLGGQTHDTCDELHRVLGAQGVENVHLAGIPEHHEQAVEISGGVV